MNLIAPTGATNFVGLSGTAYVVDNNGMINVVAGDAGAAINAGWRPALADVESFAAAAPVAANTTGLFAAITAVAAASLSIAGQPDFARKFVARYALSAGTITSGGIGITGVNSRGAVSSEVISLVGANGTASVTSAFAWNSVSNVSLITLGGNQTGTLSAGFGAALGLPMPPGAVGLSVFKEEADNATEAVGTVDATAGTIIPTTAPNGTHTYAFNYSYIAPCG